MAKTKSTGELNGFLDKESKINGELRFLHTFRMDGRLEGKALSEGVLIVGEDGRIDGEIRVKELFVSGRVRGSVRATGRVEITSGARVEADIDTPVLVVEEGAHFSGGCTMGVRADGSEPSTEVDTPVAETRVSGAVEPSPA